MIFSRFFHSYFTLKLIIIISEKNRKFILEFPSCKRAHCFYHCVLTPCVRVSSSLLDFVQEALTRNKNLASEFLQKDYNKFFDRYSSLLTSENYVTKRQSLKVCVVCCALAALTTNGLFCVRVSVGFSFYFKMLTLLTF